MADKSSAAIKHESWCGKPLGIGCTCAPPPATCDTCGDRSWCRLTSWKEGVRVVSAFLCDICRQAIPNDERGWGRGA